MVKTIIKLEGMWRSGVGSLPSVISLSEPESITIKNLVDNRIGFGIILDPSTISVTFTASQKTFTGKLEQPNRIRWLQPATGMPDWMKLIDMKGRLEGRWIPEGGDGRDSVTVTVSDQVVMSNPSLSMEVYGTEITINMSHVNRPNAHGSVIDKNTIRINFPDDSTHDGNVEEFRKIKWSNGSVWVFFIPEE